MDEVWTHGTWRVTPGSEDEFVAAWEALADWTLTVFPDARGTLLRSTEEPNVFVSFGPWADADQAARWRSAPGFGERMAVIQPLLERFEPQLLSFVMTKATDAAS